MSMYGYENVSM